MCLGVEANLVNNGAVAMKYHECPTNSQHLVMICPIIWHFPDVNIEVIRARDNKLRDNTNNNTCQSYSLLLSLPEFWIKKQFV